MVTHRQPGRHPDQFPTGPWLAIALLTFALVSLIVGLTARHEAIAPGAYPTTSYFQLFFTDPLHLKAWFATLAVSLACVQLLTAAWMFGKLRLPTTPWAAPVHRWSGRLAFAATVPVAYHCIFLLGFQTTTTRVLAHSLLGSAFYGAFAAKILIVRVHRYPSWVLPTAGGLLFAILLGAWYTSAVWFFQQVGIGR